MFHQSIIYYLQLRVVEQQLGAALEELRPGLLAQLLLQHLVIARQRFVELGDDSVAGSGRGAATFHLQIFLLEKLLLLLLTEFVACTADI